MNDIQLFIYKGENRKDWEDMTQQEYLLELKNRTVHRMP